MGVRVKGWRWAVLASLLVGVIPGALARSIDVVAREYVVLELAMAEHDPDHVDAYFGPEALRAKARAMGWTPREIGGRARSLHRELTELDAGTSPRGRELGRRLVALMTRVDIHSGDTLPFDEESLRLFGAVAPDRDDAYFDALLVDIDALLPGEGSLAERVSRFSERFYIPSEKLDAVFTAAIAECRRRTLEKLTLPASEHFSVEYVSDKPWGGYNWYQGSATSVIQVNTDLPMAIERAVDLGCHEGYPGHHVYNTLLEGALVEGRGWVEYSLYPLYSPQSLIAEGSANYGIELAFPGDERVAFERQVLFPLAGLDAAEADRYYQLKTLLARLNYARNEAARDYLNGVKDRDATLEWLVRYTLVTPERAAQSLRFVERYRSYVINYNLGKDLVADHVERGDADADTAWQRFAALLTAPISAPELTSKKDAEQ